MLSYLVEMPLMHINILLMIDLEHVQKIKDLGVTFDVKLNFSLHISDKVNKTNLIGIIKETSDIYLKNLLLCYMMLCHIMSRYVMLCHI